MDRIDAMQAFVTVADLKGFAPAARKLGMSPSGVTRLIAALEERLGARLLQRTTRQVTLTDTGARYLERARRILSDVEEAESATEGERTRPGGRLVVSAPNGFGRLHVSPVLSAYLQRYPEVSADLRLSDRMINLVEEGVDLAVRIGHLPDSTLVARHVGEMRRIVVASKDISNGAASPKRRRRSHPTTTIHFGAMTAEPEWRFVADGRDLRHEHAAVCQQQCRRRDPVCGSRRRPDPGAGLQAADSIKAGRLKIVLAPFAPPALPIHIVYPTSRLLSAKVRTFIDLVTETTHWHFV